MLTFHLCDELLFWSHLMICLNCIGHCLRCHLTKFLWSECFAGIAEYRLISSTCESRLSSEVISVVERPKESKRCWVLTLVIIFLSNNWDTLTAKQPSSKLVPLVFLMFLVIALTSTRLLLFLIFCIADNIWLCTGGGYSLSLFVLTWCVIWWGNRNCHVWVMYLVLSSKGYGKY